jgi:hypothetical protein
MSLARIGEIIVERNRLAKKRHSIRYKRDRAKRYLKARRSFLSWTSDKDAINYLPKRFRSTPIREMKLIWLRLEHQMVGVRIELAEHTENTSLELRRLLKERDMVLQRVCGDNVIRGIWQLSQYPPAVKFVSLNKLYLAIEKHQIEQILLIGDDNDMVDIGPSFSAQ